MYQRDLFGVLISVGCFVCSLVLAMTLVMSFFAAISRVLRRVSPENRLMEPGQVWLNLIPIFNLVWFTVTVERVAESLRNEFRERGMDGPNERYGRNYGLTVLALLVPGVWFYPLFLTGPFAFGFFVAYWRQLNRYADRLKPGAYSPPPIDEGW